MKILLTGGGTGGHIMPIVAVAQELKKHSHLQNKKLELLWVGEKNSQEEKAARKYHIKFESIACGKLRRYFSFKNFIDLFKIPIGLFQARRILKQFAPNAIFSKGGYVSAPIIFAAKKFKIPIFIHESDSVPGAANLFFAKDAKKIFITFPESRRYFEEKAESRACREIILSGMPLREEILYGNKRRGYRIFGLEYGRPVILFLGGSQGAKRINEFVLEMLPDLLKKYQVIHLVGEKNISEVKSRFQSKSSFVKGGNKEMTYHFFPYFEGEKLADAIACADLVVSRAGANALFEIAVYSKPLILIPYPYAAASHQIKNAQIFKKAGAARVLMEKDLSFQKLYENIREILEDERIKEKLSTNIFRIYNELSKNAAEKIVCEIIKGDSCQK